MSNDAAATDARTFTLTNDNMPKDVKRCLFKSGLGKIGPATKWNVGYVDVTNETETTWTVEVHGSNQWVSPRDVERAADMLWRYLAGFGRMPEREGARVTFRKEPNPELNRSTPVT